MLNAMILFKKELMYIMAKTKIFINTALIKFAKRQVDLAVEWLMINRS